MKIGNESELVEFKRSTSERKEAVISISSMLNKHSHGAIYFGVDDNGYVVGQDISDSTKKDITRAIDELLEPKIIPTIEVFSIDNKEIIKVTFHGKNRPYSCEGRYYIRAGSENRRMTNEELKEMIKRDDYSSKWEEELTPFTHDEIDEEALKDFYISSINSNRLTLDSYNKDKILSILDLAKDGYLKNAGYVLFAKNAKIELKLATYATDNKVTILDLKLLTGNIYTLINEALKYVLNNIKWKVEIGTRKRKEVPEIPEKALREIVVNAFAHANYEDNPGIEINIYPSKVEIYNPGTFPEDLTPLDFINHNLPSYKRNKLILDVLFRSKDVEKSGTGFQRVNDLCLKDNVTWTYRKIAYGFFFEFIRNSSANNNINNEDLDDKEETIYNLIRSIKGISKSEIAKRMNKSEKTIQRIVNELIKKNMIERVGSNKKGYWRSLY